MSKMYNFRNNPNVEAQLINTVQIFGKEISHAQWSKNPDQNVVLSPLGIAIILNLLMLGSNGSTYLELKNALNYSSDLQVEEIHETFKDILQSLQQSESGFNIFLNTGIFTRKGSEILTSYSDVAENVYSTKIHILDFQDSPTLAKEKLNCWISTSTKFKIVNEFKTQLNPNTVCLIYSVIYLEAKWENKFDTGLTKTETFNSGEENITIPMLISVMQIPYVRDEENRLEIIGLPYEGKRHFMYILKPIDDAATSKLIHLENSLDSALLDSLIGKMETQEVSVSIPRMKLEQEYNMEMDFNSLGIKEIFSRDTAYFERFSEKQKLYLSDIFHKAILQVTEDGTGDAVASLSERSETSSSKSFIMNKPSLLFVRDNENGLILFWAKVIKPKPLTAKNLDE